MKSPNVTHSGGFRRSLSKEESEIVHTPRPVITVKAFVEDGCVPEFVNNWKPGTRRGYLQITNAHVLPNRLGH